MVRGTGNLSSYGIKINGHEITDRRYMNLDMPMTRHCYNIRKKDVRH